MTTTPASLVTTIGSLYAPLLSGLVVDLTVPPELNSIDLISTPPSFTPVPVPDIPTLTLNSLTEGENTLQGDGAFDIIMKAVNKHLESQIKKGSISQTETTKVYVAALEMAMGQAVQYLVSANQAAWAGENSKRQAQMLEIQKAILDQENRTKILETITAKMNMGMVQVQAYRAQGELVATKIGIGSTYHEILHKEIQAELITEQVDTARAQTKNTLKSGAAVSGLVQQQILSAQNQALLVSEQMEAARAQTRETLSTGDPILGLVAQTKMMNAKQLEVLSEQVDSARAQTKNTILDGVTPVGGILGSQKSLYDQQRQSYIHDSKNKAAKLLSDAWTTQKTMDDGWTPPTAFLNAYLDPAIKEYISEVGLT